MAQFQTHLPKLNLQQLATSDMAHLCHPSYAMSASRMRRRSSSTVLSGLIKGVLFGIPSKEQVNLFIYPAGVGDYKIWPFFSSFARKILKYPQARRAKSQCLLS